MNRCETCKHWEKPTSGFGEVPGVGKCGAVAQYWRVSEWDEEGETRTLKPEYADKLAFVQDASDYYAALKTLPYFGCVQHEELAK